MVAAFALSSGCSTDSKNDRNAKHSELPSEGELNRELVNVAFDQQIAAGAIVDRTIYDHHFAGDGISLNALGERQVDMLLEVATDQPIKVNVPETSGAGAMHEGRVAAVRQRLLDGGVDEDRLQVVNSTPGGPGIATEIIIQSMKQLQEGGDDLSDAAGTGRSGAGSSSRGGASR